MKFAEHVSHLSDQFEKTKFSLLLLSVICLGLIVLVGSLSSRNPLLIERACETAIIEPRSQIVTEAEIKSFLTQAIPARFNTLADKEVYLSAKLLAQKNSEQEVLKQRNFKQVVLVNAVELTKEKIIVQADRVISVGEIRSAFNFPLIAKIETTKRTPQNPYGLILTEVEPVRKEGEK